VRVVRFPTSRRDGELFNQLNARVCGGGRLTPQEEHQFYLNMVHSPDLLDHIASHPQEGPFFFIPYLFTTSVWGPLLHPARSVLIPCLHDEGYARMAAVRRAFESCRAIVFHVPAERDLAASLYNLKQTEPLVLGEGVDSDWQAQGQRFRQKFNIPGPFLLYAGRKDAGKNTPLLIEYFLRYVNERQGAQGLKLILIGNLPAQIPPEGRECVQDLGFVDLQDKYDAYAAAQVFVQPSLLESFSLVIMESWLAQTPVLVHVGCRVTRDHVEASGGGMHFADYPQFARRLDDLLSKEDLRLKMGAAGRAYVLDNYSWPEITRRYQELIQRLENESTTPARAPAKRATSGKTRVHQMLADFAYGDAIGNDALAIRKQLRSWGLDSEIFAQHLHPRLENQARSVEEYVRQATEDDILIFHFSIGHPLADRVLQMPGRKVIRYHNITPAKYLERTLPLAAERARMGRAQLTRLAPQMELGLGVSPYNCSELEEAGCPLTEVVPILMDWEVLKTPPDPSVLSRFQDGRPTILHVGRVAPNKCLEDHIKAQYWLNRLLPQTRLLLVGGGGDTPYGIGLRKLADDLGVTNVHFAGHVSNAALMAYYQAADLYLCLSEHEGFCVPLVESMYFGLPIAAFASSGVPGTLDKAGWLIKEKTPALTAEITARILKDKALAQAMTDAGRARLEAFQPQTVASDLKRILTQHLNLELP
jgi:glycosyltransferase involved in cell wall biosynthesis